MSVVGRFSFSDIIVLVLGECTGVPLCIAGGEAFAHSEWIPATIGWGIGIPLVVAGASFHFWKDSVKTRVVTVIRPYTWVFVPIAVLLAFIYVVGPNIYRRAMMTPQFSEVSAPDIEKTTAAIRTELEASQHQVTLLQSQLAAAIKERDAARQAPTPSSPSIQKIGKYELTDDEIRGLADEIFQIKNQLPPSADIQRVLNDSSSVGLSSQIGRAFDLASIPPVYNWNRPITPKDLGIRIRVSNIQDIPDGAKKLALAFRKFNLQSNFETLSGEGPDNFEIFIGPRP